MFRLPIWLIIALPLDKEISFPIFCFHIKYFFKMIFILLERNVYFFVRINLNIIIPHILVFIIVLIVTLIVLILISIVFILIGIILTLNSIVLIIVLIIIIIVLIFIWVLIWAILLIHLVGVLCLSDPFSFFDNLWRTTSLMIIYNKSLYFLTSKCDTIKYLENDLDLFKRSNTRF